MAQENLQQVYDTLSTDFEMPPFEQFVEKMGNSSNRSQVYRTLSEKFDMPLFEEFDQKVMADIQAGPSIPSAIKTAITRGTEGLPGRAQPGLMLLNTLGLALDSPLIAFNQVMQELGLREKDTTIAEEIAAPVTFGERGRRALPEAAERQIDLSDAEEEARRKLIGIQATLSDPLLARTLRIAETPEERKEVLGLNLELFADLGGLIGSVAPIVKARKTIKNKKLLDDVLTDISRKPKDIAARQLDRINELAEDVITKRTTEDIFIKQIQDETTELQEQITREAAGTRTATGQTEVDVTQLPDVKRDERLRELGEIDFEVEEARRLKEEEAARKAAEPPPPPRRGIEKGAAEQAQVKKEPRFKKPPELPKPEEQPGFKQFVDEIRAKQGIKVGKVEKQVPKELPRIRTRKTKITKTDPNRVVKTGKEPIEVADQAHKPEFQKTTTTKAYDDAISGKRPSEISSKKLTPEEVGALSARIQARKQTQTDQLGGLKKTPIKVKQGRPASLEDVPTEKVGKSKLRQFTEKEQDIINVLRKQFAEEIEEARGGRIPLETTFGRAAEIPDDQMELILKNLYPGQVLNSEQMAKASFLLRDRMANLILSAIEDRPNKLLTSFEGAKSETGRTLRVLQAVLDDPDVSKKVRAMWTDIRRGDVSKLRQRALDEIKGYSANINEKKAKARLKKLESDLKKLNKNRPC